MKFQHRPLWGMGACMVDQLAHVPQDLPQHLGFALGHSKSLKPHDLATITSTLPLQSTPGGSVGNAIVLAAQLGANTGFRGRVGQDAQGRYVQDAFLRAGVQAVLDIDPILPTSTCVSLITPDGQRSMAACMGACSALTPASLSSIPPQAVLFLEAYLAATAPHVLPGALFHQGPIAFTLSDPRLIQKRRHQLTDMVERAEVVLANEEEALAYTGQDPKGACIRLSQGKLCVITCGSKGVLLGINGVVSVLPSHAVAQVLDTTGAGDAFAGGFLAGLLAGWDPHRACDLGLKTAARCIQHLGARLPNAALLDLKICSPTHTS